MLHFDTHYSRKYKLDYAAQCSTWNVAGTVYELYGYSGLHTEGSKGEVFPLQARCGPEGG